MFDRLDTEDYTIRIPMPELPEVETIARRLETGGLPGKEILSLEMRWPRHIALPTAERAREIVVGRRFESIARRGKFLVFELAGWHMLIHLRMSGDLRLEDSGAPLQKHDLTIWRLSGGSDLRFHDPRRFGRVWITEHPEEVLGRLGPEPLDASFSAAELGDRLVLHRRLLKPLLLDQTFVAGIGNIYADEALHRARLHPLRLSDSLSSEEARRLWRGIRAALRAGLHHHGTSIDWVYREGRHQHLLRVYGREGQSCGVCGTVIRRIKVGQRSSYFCPYCQKVPRKK
jgi:formamidopyrimidine-DNA glycosylase